MLIVGFALFSSGTEAANSDVEIHCVAKKVNEETKKAAQGSRVVVQEGSVNIVSGGGTNRTKENWIYELTIENKTFKELNGLEVRYAIFFNKEKLGVKAAPTVQHQNGTLNIPALKPHEKQTFSTDAVELDKANLVGEWHYTNGAKPGAHDTLVGLALRIFQNGQQFAEYANPSTLLREKWE
ncbi:MAG: hypothetical protein QOH24_981 [Verrucomicrobiota bacterium]|jgi:hypothetical protein